MATIDQFDLRAYTHAIAEALGPEWQPDCPEDDWRAYIRHRDDEHYALFLGRLFQHGPGGRGDGLSYREKRAEIRVSYARPPDRVARDIQRRLYPSTRSSISATRHMSSKPPKPRPKGCSSSMT